MRRTRLFRSRAGAARPRGVARRLRRPDRACRRQAARQRQVVRGRQENRRFSLSGGSRRDPAILEAGDGRGRRGLAGPARDLEMGRAQRGADAALGLDRTSLHLRRARLALASVGHRRQVHRQELASQPDPRSARHLGAACVRGDAGGGAAASRRRFAAGGPRRDGTGPGELAVARHRRPGAPGVDRGAGAGGAWIERGPGEGMADPGVLLLLVDPVSALFAAGCRPHLRPRPGQARQRGRQRPSHPEVEQAPRQKGAAVLRPHDRGLAAPGGES